MLLTSVYFLAQCSACICDICFNWNALRSRVAAKPLSVFFMPFTACMPVHIIHILILFTFLHSVAPFLFFSGLSLNCLGSLFFQFLVDSWWLFLAALWGGTHTVYVQPCSYCMNVSQVSFQLNVLSCVIGFLATFSRQKYDGMENTSTR